MARPRLYAGTVVRFDLSTSDHTRNAPGLLCRMPKDRAYFRSSIISLRLFVT
jgi:hypothetical protein